MGALGDRTAESELAELGEGDVAEIATVLVVVDTHFLDYFVVEDADAYLGFVLADAAAEVKVDIIHLLSHAEACNCRYDLV